MNANFSCVLAISLLIGASPAHGSLVGEILSNPLLAPLPSDESGYESVAGYAPDCHSQPDFSIPLSLSTAVNTALCNNLRVRAAWADVKAQSASIGEARAAYLPTLNGSVSRLKNSTSYPESSGQQGFTSRGVQKYGSLSFRLFDFGGREANLEAAHLLMDAAIAGHNVALTTAIRDAIKAYFDASAAQAVRAVRKDLTEFAGAAREAASERIQRGNATQHDLSRAVTAEARAKLNESRAEGDYQRSLALLKQVMGIAQATTIDVREPSYDIRSDSIGSLDNWLQDAEEQHPAIKQAQAKWSADKARIVSVRSEGLPTLDLSGTVSKNGYPNQGLSAINQTVRSVGVTLNIPLFEGFGRTYKLQAARAQAEKSADLLQDTVDQTLMNVVNAYADAKTAFAALSASDSLQKAAQAAFESSNRRYVRNAADVAELLDARSGVAEAKLERIRAVADWRSAWLTLFVSSGTLRKLPKIKEDN